MMWTKSKPENIIEKGTTVCLFDFDNFKAGDIVNFMIYEVMGVKMVKLNGVIVIPYADFLWNFEYLEI